VKLGQSDLLNCDFGTNSIVEFRGKSKVKLGYIIVRSKA